MSMVNSADPIIVRAGVGLVLAAALVVVVRYGRRKAAGHVLVERLLAARVHYAVAGFLVGYAAPPELGQQVRTSVQLLSYFLLAWIALTLGLGLDQRTLHRGLAPRLLVEGLQAGAVALVVLAARYAWAEIAPRQALDLRAGVVLAGLCAALAPRAGGRHAAQTRRRTRDSRLATGACLGVFVGGFGSLSLRSGTRVLGLPLGPDAGALTLNHIGAEMAACLLLGGVTGLLLDLLTRGVKPRYLLLLVTGGLSLGAGIGAALGLEPSWIGLVAGAWWINSTLQRVDVLRTVERVHPLMIRGIFGAAGWQFGDGLLHVGFAPVIFGGCLVAVCLIRPLAAWCGGLVAGRLAATGTVELGRPGKVWNMAQLDGVPVALALGLFELLGGGAGVAALAAVLVGQWVICLLGSRAWSGESEDTFPAAARLST